MGIDNTSDGGFILNVNSYIPNQTENKTKINTYLLRYYPNGHVGFVDLSKDVSAYAYPNPAKDNINFSCSELIKEIEVFNLLGQQVYSAKVKDKFTSINTTNFISGNYIAKLHTGKGIVVKKFVIE